MPELLWCAHVFQLAWGRTFFCNLISFWCAHLQLCNSKACFYKWEVLCRKGWIHDFQLWIINRYHRLFQVTTYVGKAAQCWLDWCNYCWMAGNYPAQFVIFRW